MSKRADPPGARIIGPVLLFITAVFLSALTSARAGKILEPQFVGFTPKRDQHRD